MRSPSPKPDVVFLPAIFRAIKEGEIRVPAFQRGFVWKTKQVLALLESVYSGYPIGSLLFWTTDSESMRTADNTHVPFPSTTNKGTVDFVLDGMQRISSLYGAFNAPEQAKSVDEFAIAFDLRSRVFVQSKEKNEACLELRTLFVPRQLLEEQARLGSMPDGEILVEQTLELQRRFQEYLIPVVRIRSADSTEVVRIFERVNSTGTTLGAVDFMRALTWSTEFDLTEELDELASSLQGLGFEVPQDTIAKALALQLGVLPISDEMVKLRTKDPQELNLAVAATRDALSRAAYFLIDGVGIRSYDYVPYEGQFLVFVSVAMSNRDVAPPRWLIEWYWNVGFSEALQGRPDHYVAKLAIEAQKNLPLIGFESAVTVPREILQNRAVRKGAALPMTLIASLAKGNLHSACSGRKMSSDAVLSGYDPASVAPVFEKKSLQYVLAKKIRTEKVIANTVLLDVEDKLQRHNPAAVRDAILRTAEKPGGMDFLRSQCISMDCVKAIQDKSAQLFIEARAKEIQERILQATGAPDAGG